jgi:hypothetical protein
MENYFGPSLFRSKESMESKFKTLSKEEWIKWFDDKKIKDTERKYNILKMHRGAFPKRTKDEIDGLILALKSKPNLIRYEVEDNALTFPGTNDLVRVKNIVTTVMKNAGINDYKFASTVDGKSPTNELKSRKLKLIRSYIKEEVKSILSENKNTHNIVLNFANDILVKKFIKIPTFQKMLAPNQMKTLQPGNNELVVNNVALNGLERMKSTGLYTLTKM